jgi:hypothetical protein
MEKYLSETVRVQRERKFAPYHLLLSSADFALESAEKKEPGYFHYELMIIMFSALALEGMANTFGELVIADWHTKERKPPIVKLRTLAEKFDVFRETHAEPWPTLEWLFRFRNQIAHPKPEEIQFDQTMPQSEFRKLQFQVPKSKLEEQVTLANAHRARNAAESIKDEFLSKIDPDLRHGLLADSFSTKVSSAKSD